MNHQGLSQPVGHEKRVAAIKIQLHSQLPSDVRRGIDQARKLLQEDPLNYEIYPLLLEIAKETPAQRDEIRNLLQSIAQKGLRHAVDFLKNLDAITNPIQHNPDSKKDYAEGTNRGNKQNLIDDADDAYYAAEFDKSISLYRKVLQNEPDNKRAQLQLEKAELNRINQQPNRKLPREAMQYYRRARSFIAARDIGSAISMLNAAIEEAQAYEMKFQEAEELLGSLQNLQIASEYKEYTIKLVQDEKWDEALEQYERILKLDPEDEASRVMRDKLRKLLETEALLITLGDSLDDEIIRREKLEKIVSSITAGEEIMQLAGTQRLTIIRAKYNIFKAEIELHKWGFFIALAPQGRLRETKNAAERILNSEDPALKYVKMRIKQFKPFRALFYTLLILIIGFLLFFMLNGGGIHPPPSTITPTSATNPAPSMTRAPQLNQTSSSVTLTITINSISSPITTTASYTPTQAIIGVGYINFFLINAREVPNGKSVRELKKNQVVTILDQDVVSGDRWYLCQWTIDESVQSGWILAEYIILGSPTPTRTSTK